MCFKCESASRLFQPGESPSRGLLRDCENRVWNRRSTTQHYSAGMQTERLNRSLKNERDVLIDFLLVGTIPTHFT